MAALMDFSIQRADFGAYQNRLELLIMQIKILKKIHRPQSQSLEMRIWQKLW